KQRGPEENAPLHCREHPRLASDPVFTSLVARENLGSTGFGNGNAIPHCRLHECTQPVSAVIQLDNPTDFDAIDGAPV
ncbi:PTS sugar transporter subunit IIA, partial [Pseudomonas syringae group genomosp. 7]